MQTETEMEGEAETKRDRDGKRKREKERKAETKKRVLSAEFKPLEPATPEVCRRSHSKSQ